MRHDSKFLEYSAMSATAVIDDSDAALGFLREVTTDLAGKADTAETFDYLGDTVTELANTPGVLMGELGNLRRAATAQDAPAFRKALRALQSIAIDINACIVVADNISATLFERRRLA